MPLVRLLLAFTLAFLAAESRAEAQGCAATPDPAALQTARQLFIDGSADVEAGRWSDAIQSFERAYGLSCAPSALYNLAMALRALGRHRESRDAFDRLLTNHPRLTGELSANTTNYRREEAARVAILELVGIDPSVRPEISFDGEAVVDQGARPIVIETDAGSHSLVAQIPEYRPFLWEGRVTDGQRESIAVSFQPLPIGEGGVEVWPILLAVIGAALIGGGIALGFFLQDDAQIDPLQPDRLVNIP